MDLLPVELRSFTVTRHIKLPEYTEHHLTRPGWKEEIAVRDFATLFLQGKEQQEYFRQRVKGWLRLGIHPHLQTCYGPLPGHESAFFLEKKEGESLAQLISSGSLSFRSILSLAMQICHGVEQLHAHNIVNIPLVPENIFVSSSSLAKICDIVNPRQSEVKQTKSFFTKSDIIGFGSLLWKMARVSQPQETMANLRVNKKRGTPLKLLGTFLTKCASSKGYEDFSVIRRELNALYHDSFAVDCPYYEIPLDFQAQYLNNQAVLHFETGRYREGIAFLDKALRLKDRLSEAIYNLIAYKLRSGIFSPAKILLMIESASVDNSVGETLARLKKITEVIQEKGVSRKLQPPPFLLCPPVRSLSFYRQEKQRKKMRSVIENHRAGLRYESCLKTLLSAWKKEKFQKNSFFSTTHERLLSKSDKLDIAGVQRYAILKQSNQPIKNLCYVPGTKKIAANFDGKTVCLLNYGDGAQNVTLQSDGEQINALTVSPNGKIIAAAMDSGVLFFWQTKNGKKILQEKVHEGEITSIDFSHDSRFFASGGVDGRLVTRSISTGNEKIVTPWEEERIEALAFVPGLLDLVIVSNGGEVKIMAARGKKCLHTIPAHNQPVTSLSIAPRGDFFATCAGEIKIWDRHSGECLETIEAHDAAATETLLLDDNRHLISAGMDDIIRIQDLVTGDVAAVLDGRGSGIRCLAKGSQPHFFFAGQQGGELLIWKLIYNLSFS
ncbi:MAG: protein kinase [Pseudomonadota bacterium]